MKGGSTDTDLLPQTALTELQSKLKNMSVLIIDLGNSHLKFSCYKAGNVYHFCQVPTPETVDGILHEISQRLQGGYYYLDEGEGRRATSVNTVMIISFSDAVFYDKTDGSLHQFRSADIVPRHPALPPYQETGKPTNSQLAGIGNQLLYLRDTVGLKNIRKLLPPSLFIGAHLTGATDWKRWDITHASNSGMWDYENGNWHAAMHPFFDAGVIDAKVVKPSAVLWHSHEIGYPEIKFLCGGHDSVFANANDVPYSTKPYLSLGTWTTASVESEFRKLDRHHPSRFVIAPNGAILHQLCIRSSEHSLQQGIKFLEGKQPTGPVRVFGGWAKAVLPELKSDTLKFECVDAPGRSFLHKQAARYTRRHI